MVELTAESGKTAKRTAMGSARDQRDRLATKDRGTTVSNLAEFMFGQTAIDLRANGSAAADTGWGLSIGENGLTKVNGKKVLKPDTVSRNLRAGLVTKEVGPLDCKKVTALRSTPMEVSFSSN